MVWEEELLSKESQQEMEGIRGVDDREPRVGHRILQRAQPSVQDLLSILEERWM